MMETYDLVVSLVFLDADIKEKLSYRFFSVMKSRYQVRNHISILVVLRGCETCFLIDT